MLNNTGATDLIPKDLTTAIVRNPITVSPKTAVREAIALMSQARSYDEANLTAQSAANYAQMETRASCVIVVESHRVIGIFTERDVVHLCAKPQLLDEMPVSQVMTPVLTLRESALTDPFSAINLLQQNNVRHLPIVDEQDCLVGLVTHETLQQVLQPVANIHQRLQLEQVITNVATAIRASLHLQTILDTAVEQIRQVIHCDRANIWRVEPDLSSVVVAEATQSTLSLLGEQVQDVCYQSQLLEVYREGHVRVVTDIYTTEMTDCHRELLIRLQTRAKVLLPLFCGDRLWGLLNVSESQAARNWQADEIDLLRKLATQLTIAIQQASTHEQLQIELQERQQAEAQLRQSTERLQEAQRIAHLGHWELNLQHNTLYWCKEVFRLFELDPQQCSPTYEIFWEFVHPDDRDTFNEAFNKHLRDQQPFSIVHRLLMPDGRIKYVRGQCETTSSTDSTPLILQGTVQDITQQQEAEMHRERVETSLRQVINGTAAFTGEAFFPALVRHIAEALEVRYVSVSQATAEGFQVLAFFADGELRPPPFLPYDSVPYCRQALQTGSCYHPANVQTLYPGSALVTDLQVESYLGVGLRNAAGEPTGSFCIFHDRPLADPDWAQTLLSIFAARAGAELDRLLTAQALEQLNVELEERVTQRTRMLTEREARYRGLMEGAADAILLINLQGYILEANQQAEALLGYSLAELPTLHFTQLHPPEELDKVTTAFAETAQRQRIQSLDVTFLRQDGTTVSVDITANVIDINGEVLVQGILRDITDRKQAEAALRESERRCATLAQAAPVAIFRFDREGHCIYVNEGWCEMTGKPASLALDDRWLETVHPDDRERSQTVIQQWFQSGATKPFQHEARVLRDDGSIVWYYCQMLVETDSKGQPIGYIGTLTNISDRKAAEMQIRQQADRETLLREITQRIRQSLDLQTIFDTACQEIRLVLQADRVGIFKFYPNSNWDDGEFVAESVVEGFVSAMAIRIHDHCFGEKYAPLYLQGRYAAMEDIYQLESQCHTDVLAQFQVRANLIMPLLDGDNLWGLLCIHQCRGTRQWQPFEIDLTQHLGSQLAIAIQQASLYEQLQQELTERQQAQNQLTERNQQLAVTNIELERATRLKDEFLANMSHELRTPLNAILGMTEGLQDEIFGIVNERQLQALDTIEGSASHLLSLINDILDVAKIESGQIKLEYSHVAVEQLCSSSLTFVKQQALKKHIQLNTQIPPHLPDLFVDEIRMRQVLLNLLTNAVKFTPEGGTVTLAVSLLSQAEDPARPTSLHIAITDTGIGIAPENISKLFKPFVQIDGALNRQQTGTGLGLALVKQIVELHGGQVGLTSELGVGSCFTVDLPYELEVSSIFQTESSPIATEVNLSTPYTSDPTYTQAPLILLAEDNPDNITAISTYLEAKGYRFLVANNGQEAIDLALSHQPDVILMDVQMPGLDGLEAMKQIRQQENLRETPIIALTALAMKGDRERCLEAGANHYLSKPVKLKQLDTSIKELLAERSLE